MNYFNSNPSSEGNAPKDSQLQQTPIIKSYQPDNGQPGPATVDYQSSSGPGSSDPNDYSHEFDPVTRNLSLPKTTIVPVDEQIETHDLLKQFHHAVKHFKSSKLNLRARKTSLKLNHPPLSFDEEYSESLSNKMKVNPTPNHRITANSNSSNQSQNSDSKLASMSANVVAGGVPNQDSSNSSVLVSKNQQPLLSDSKLQATVAQTVSNGSNGSSNGSSTKQPPTSPSIVFSSPSNLITIPPIVHNEASKIVFLYIPILICLFFVIYSVATFEYYQASIKGFAIGNMLPEDDIEIDDQDMLDRSQSGNSEPTVNLENLKKPPEKAANNPWFIVGFILLIFGLVVLCSICILLLYKYECYNLIYAFFLMAFILYLGGFPVVYIQEMVFHYNWATDWITLIFFLFNYVAVGILALFHAGPKCLKQFYHILICGILALFLIKLLNKWMEIGLLIVLICWDCYAVLHQKGPLNNLLDTVEQKGQALPPIVFQMTVWLQVDRNSSSRNRRASTTNETIVKDASRTISKQQQQGRKGSNTSNKLDGNESDYEIGLGDFIFFSFLVGKAHLYAGLIGSIFTMLAVITGLTLTLFLLLICDRPLPALPIPISFGLITQLCAEYFLVPLADSMNSKLIVL